MVELHIDKPKHRGSKVSKVDNYPKAARYGVVNASEGVHLRENRNARREFQQTAVT